ncbi:unnamed protein product, partial [Vitis vinifera]
MPLPIHPFLGFISDFNQNTSLILHVLVECLSGKRGILGKSRASVLAMNRWSSIIWFLLSGLLFNVESQAAPGQENFSSQDAVTAFKPSLAVVIGILAVMFLLTFILLVYAKLCHRASNSDRENQQGLTRSESRFSGIDKTVIESLPFFRFCSLKGSKEGLECAVCLSKFEDIEILRLLPKCKHAFHIDCVDQWLEKHSSCPLCRHKVSAEDLAILTYSNSLRFLWNQSELRENSNLELFGVKEEESVLIQEEEDDNDDEKILHKINHKIIVSDVVLKNRWSSVSSSDLMYLNSELVHAMSSDRFASLDSNNSAMGRPIEDWEVMKIKEEIERKRIFESRVSRINHSNPVSSSGLPSTSKTEANSGHASRFLHPTEKRSIMRRLWLPIARRTVEWFANREGSQQSQNTKQAPDV